MADHTLLHGVQAALDRRLRNRALDLQAQGMQMQDEDRDTRERDMQRRIIDQHNLNSAKLAANANKPDPNAWREGWQAAITQRELEQERIRQAGNLEKQGKANEGGVQKQEKANEGGAVVANINTGAMLDATEKKTKSAEKVSANTNWTKRDVAEKDRKSKELISDRADQTKKAIADTVARARRHLALGQRGGGGSKADTRKLRMDLAKAHSDLLNNDGDPSDIAIIKKLQSEIENPKQADPE